MTYGLWAPGDSELYVALAKYQVREDLDEYWGGEGPQVSVWPWLLVITGYFCGIIHSRI